MTLEDFNFLERGGEAGRAMRAFDWEKSGLGLPSSWPKTLKNAIRLILDNGAPMYIAWGPELNQFYNDGYISILGRTKHPHAIGRGTKETFPEIWPTIGPMFDRVLKGESVFYEDLNLPLERNGKIADSYFTFSYSPLRNDEGKILGVFVVAIETTSKKLAQVDSEIAQKTLHRQMMQAPIGIAVLEGPTHIFRLTNPTYLLLLKGKKQEDLINRSVAEALPEVVEQGFLSLLDQVYQSGEPFLGKELPLKINQPTGEEKSIFVDFIYQPSRDASGQVKGILVVATDVTEKVNAREAIHCQNLWLEEVLNRLPIGLIMAEPGSAKYRFVNDAASVMLGQSPQDTRPELSYDKLIVRDLDNKILSVDEIPSARAARGEELINEVIILELGQSQRFVSCNSSTIPAMHGFSETVLVPFLDISDLKAKENKLVFERRQLETIFQYSPAAMALWRGPDFVFEKVNPHYQAIFPDRVLLGKPFFEALPEFAGQPFLEMLTTVYQTGEPFVGKEILARHASAAGGPIEDHYYDFTYIRVHDANGRPYGVYNHAIDVTDRVRDRKKLEAAKHEAEQAKFEADRANQLKSSFLANMSHEIRTPLGAMIGFAALLREPAITPAEHSSYVDVLVRNGEQLSYIINDILDLSKVEAGHLTLEFLPSSPRAIAADILSLLGVKAKEKGLVLESVADDSTPYEVISDPFRIRQILINLVGNAIKFTPHGTVNIKSYGFKNKEGRLSSAYEISDTGVGISPSQANSIFEMFVQGDGSMTRRFGGTGIGLSLSRNLARALGGDIILKSTAPNQGSTFLFTFESCPEKKESKLAQPISAPAREPQGISGEAPLKGTPILVVDDSPDNRQLIWHFLTKAGAIVETAENGVEGYKRALSGRHALILMDLQMPLMDGYTATQKLREHGYFKPIIALTAHAMDEIRKKCLNVGYTDYLSKPINPKELIEAISRYTNQDT